MFFNQIVKSKDVKNIYKHTGAFNRAVKYLICSGLVYKVAPQQFKLSLKGDMIARILLTLSDIPPHLKEFSRVFKTDEDVDTKWLQA